MTIYTKSMIPSDEIYCWGANQYGQLGDGSYTNRLTPVQVRLYPSNFYTTYLPIVKMFLHHAP